MRIHGNETFRCYEIVRIIEEADSIDWEGFTPLADVRVKTYRQYSLLKLLIPVVFLAAITLAMVLWVLIG